MLPRSSVRVDGWRYTCWFRFNGHLIVPITTADGIIARELYDHREASALAVPGAHLVHVPLKCAGRPACVKRPGGHLCRREQEQHTAEEPRVPNTHNQESGTYGTIVLACDMQRVRIPYLVHP